MASRRLRHRHPRLPALGRIPEIPEPERMDPRMHTWGLYDRLLEKCRAMSFQAPVFAAEIAQLALAVVETLVPAGHGVPQIVDFRARAFGCAGKRKTACRRFRRSRPSLPARSRGAEKGNRESSGTGEFAVPPGELAQGSRGVPGGVVPPGSCRCDLSRSERLPLGGADPAQASGRDRIPSAREGDRVGAGWARSDRFFPRAAT